MLYVYAVRYSKNGNKTYSHFGPMTIEELKKIMNKVFSKPDKEWRISIHNYTDDLTLEDIDV